MPANLKQPFGPSCCDGGATPLNDRSAQVCGCDKGANHLCERHTNELKERDSVLRDTSCAPIDPSVTATMKVGQWSSFIPVQETIVVDEKTGGRKGMKLARFALIPAEFLWALAEHYGVGAKKYDDNNWLKGYKWSLTMDALERHLNLVKQGEWIDKETGSAHIIAVAWHCAALFTFKLRGLGTNDINERLNG